MRRIEEVSLDCSDGSGTIKNIGPYNTFMVVRTKHLDEPRNPNSHIQRDHDFDCETFHTLVNKFFQRRPLGVKNGKYSIFWRNEHGVQSAVIHIDNDTKKVIFVTIIQLDKRHMNDYRKKQHTIRINLGLIA